MFQLTSRPLLACLNSLRFPSMLNRQQAIDSPVDNTCQWLMQTPSFTNWINRQNMKEHFGLFQIIGKPGSGKSTLIKKAFDQIYSQLSGPNVCVAGFFFHSQGNQLQHSPSGLFRSLLYQTLPFHYDQFQYFISLYSSKEKDDNHNVEWHQSELKSIFHSIFSKPGLVGRTIIFIDALDECDNAYIREVAYYFREITRSAFNAGVELDVCISRRHYPLISLTYCPEIRMEDSNGPDIQHYIGLRFETADLSADNQWNALGTQVLQRSEGVFLWAVLVVDVLLKERDLGKNMKYLERRTKELPRALEQLFVELLKDIHPTEGRATLRLFQWVFLATGSLRLNEWHHILAFIREPPPSSLAEWRESEHYTETDDQLERQIRSISRGLVEVKAQRDFELEMEDRGSIYAGAGSLDSAYGDSRLVQPIHESVREFFLHGKGFSLFDQSLCNNFVGNGHLALLSCCLDYLNIRELDAFINARLKSKRSLLGHSYRLYYRRLPPEYSYCPYSRRDSVASFGSSASCHSAGGSKEYSESIPSPLLDPFRSSSLGPVWFDEIPIESNNERMKHNADNCEDASDEIPVPSVLSSLNLFRNEETNRRALLSRHKLQNSENSAFNWNSHEQQYLPDETIGETTEGEQKRYSLQEWVTDSSVTRISQTLEDYLALQSYAVNRAFIHAKIAEREGADPSGIVKKLLDTSAWTRWASLQENITRETSLFGFIAEQGLVTWIEHLVKVKDDCDDFKDELEDTLISAIRRGDRKVMKSLIKAGACFPRDSRRTLIRKSPLHHIILSSNLELLKFFWANIEACFAGLGQQKMREILDREDELQLSPLHLAVKNGDISMAEELVNYGADMNAQNNTGETPLHLAIIWGHYNAVKELLKHGADVSSQNNTGDTPLHLAAMWGHYNAVEELLKHGADTDARNNAGETPLQLAAMWGHYSDIEELLKHGAHRSAQDKFGRLPFN